LFKGSNYNPEHAYGHKVPLQYPSITKMINDITNYLNIINKYSTLNDIPVFIDECDAVVDHRYGIYDNPNYIVNNTEYYPAIVASMIYNIPLISPRIKLITHWAFYMEGKRFFEGTRTLITNYNLYLPILNGLKLFEKLKTNKLLVEISNSNIPLNGICTFDENNFDIQLLLFSHVDDYTFNVNENLTIKFNNIKSKYVLVRHYKIDANNNNIYSEWIKMGKPNYLNDEQLAYFQNFQQLKLFNTPVLYEIQDNKLILDSLYIATHSVDFFEIVNVD
jgi:xylan 1,4-beta-xylosidase